MAQVVHCKKSKYDVYIGRPSKWGNPFTHLSSTKYGQFYVKTREESIASYENWLLQQPNLVDEAKLELKGKVLGCWCAPLSCHGDVLMRIANSQESSTPLSQEKLIIKEETGTKETRTSQRIKNYLEKQQKLKY
jgi:hypothetical protein